MARNIALACGFLLVLVGFLGFIPNPLVGPTGFLEANTVHDAAHLLVGFLVMWVATIDQPKLGEGLKILGVLFLLRSIVAFIAVPDGGTLFGFLSSNIPDHVLHLSLGLALLGAGFLGEG